MQEEKSFLYRLVKNIITIISTYSLLIVVIILFVQVVGRYLFNYSVRWIEELARYLTICMVFFAGVSALKNDQLVGIKFFYDLLPKNIQKKVTIFVNISIIVFLLIMVFYGFKLAYLNMVNGQLSPSLRIPMWWAYATIPVGGVLMIIFYLIELFGNKSNNK